MKALDRFYLIVDRAAWIARLAPSGLRLVQLRAKGLAPPALRAELRAALAVCAAHGITLVVNDHWQAAIEEGASFVHLGQEDLDGADLAALRRAGLRLGVSTHDEAELERALSVGPDYVALGPVYPTTLKAMPWAPQGLARIGSWKRRIGTRPLVAIGGITPERAADCLAAGADSVAVVSAVVGHADPLGRAHAFMAATGSARRSGARAGGVIPP